MQLWVDLFEAFRSLSLSDFKGVIIIAIWLLFLAIPIQSFDLNDQLTQWTYVGFMSMLWTFLSVMFSPGWYESSPGPNVLLFGVVCMISGIRWSLAVSLFKSPLEARFKLNQETVNGDHKKKS